MEKFNANFHRVSDPQLLGKTKRGNDGFRSTGVQVIKKAKKVHKKLHKVNRLLLIQKRICKLFLRNQKKICK